MENGERIMAESEIVLKAERIIQAKFDKEYKRVKARGQRTKDFGLNVLMVAGCLLLTIFVVR